MHLSIEDFCEIVKGLNGTSCEKALAVLWYHDQNCADVCMGAGELCRLLDDHHVVSSPHSTRLAESIRKTRLANESKRGFALKPGSRSVIRKWLPNNLEGIQPSLDHSSAYLPKAIWQGTRGYIESVCIQMNGCYAAAYYDAAAVMLRRLLETLIIEAYEHLAREHEIKDSGGNYLMLKDLVDRACGEKGNQGLNLGRDVKSTLKDVREIGNWAAHARRYNAVAADFKKINAGTRVTVQEFIQIANLKR